MVSLLECELRSNAMKTMTVPTIRMAKPTIRAGHFSDFILACSDYFDSSEPLDETVAETRDVMLRRNQKSYGVFVPSVAISTAIWAAVGSRRALAG